MVVTKHTDNGMVSHLQIKDYLGIAGLSLALMSPVLGWVWRIESRVQRIEDTGYSREMAEDMTDRLEALDRHIMQTIAEDKVALTSQIIRVQTFQQTILETLQEMKRGRG